MADEIAVQDQMSSELSIPQSAQVAKYVNDDLFDRFVSTYLPRLQLFDSNSNDVKTRQIPIGHYGLKNANTLIDLGDTISIFICSMRFKALDLNDGVKSFFNPNSAEFLRVKATSEGQNTGCLCGPEFLVYVPDMQKFATFFMSSKTMRREAPNVKALLGKACTLRTHLIEKKPYTWYGPQATPCTTPLSLPAGDRLNQELETFNNPPEQVVEEIDEAEAAAAAARAR
jgi:hypothetical protein